MLLDRKIVAGCGNIYACEALFRAGIPPARKIKDTSHQERQMLFYYVQEVLKEVLIMVEPVFQIIVMQTEKLDKCNYI